jgi:DNA sulfur modification protein DndE
VVSGRVLNADSQPPESDNVPGNDCVKKGQSVLETALILRSIYTENENRPMKTLAGLSLLLMASAFQFAPSAPIELPTVQSPTFRKDTLTIGKFGAVADGLTLNTSAINKAIEQCNRAGGGVVLVPRGLWLTGPIVLKSNVNLYLAEGALLQFTDQRNVYPLVNTTWEGEEAVRNQAPVSGTDLENIAITGKGILDGAGDSWRAVKRSKLTDDQWKKLVASGGVVNDKKDMWYPSAQSMKGSTTTTVKAGQPMSYYEDIKDFLRPNMLSLTRCKRILLEGVTFQNSPAWCLHPLLCEHITLRGVTAKNPWHAQNGDGIDLESCRNGLIDDCTFDVGDDGICIKSGRDEQGRKRGVPTENIIVRNCRVYHAHGGFVIGSEMSGGVRNLYVSNCQFMGTDVGLRFKSARGRGGVVENIVVDGIDMTNIAGEAILFDMYYAAKDPVPQQGESNELPQIPAQPLSEATPQFRSFQIRNVTCKGAETGIMVRGLPEMAVKDVLIENAVLQSRKGLVCIEAENIRLKNVALITPAKTLMQIQNSRDLTLDNIRYADNTDLLMHISGNRSKNIKLLNTSTSHVKKTAETTIDVPANALTMK